VILGKTGAYLQSGGVHVCLTGAGWICAVDRGSSGWRDRGPVVDRAVDVVHRSTVDQIKGVRALLIWTVRADRTALVAHGRGRRGDGRPAVAPADGEAVARQRWPERSSGAPNSKANAWRGRGGGGEVYRRFGEEG
jgi:hypothetical protein